MCSTYNSSTNEKHVYITRRFVAYDGTAFEIPHRETSTSQQGLLQITFFPKIIFLCKVYLSSYILENLPIIYLDANSKVSYLVFVSYEFWPYIQFDDESKDFLLPLFKVYFIHILFVHELNFIKFVLNLYFFQNPSKPHFNHYLFESICVGIRTTCKHSPEAVVQFEQVLFEPFTFILQSDVQGTGT